jgi:hypothetical protein
MAPEEPHQKRDQRAPGQEEHQQVRAEVAGAIQDCFHEASLAPEYRKRVSERLRAVTRVTKLAET